MTPSRSYFVPLERGARQALDAALVTHVGADGVHGIARFPFAEAGVRMPRTVFATSPTSPVLCSPGNGQTARFRRCLAIAARD
jgi:hypothetical protein